MAWQLAILLKALHRLHLAPVGLHGEHGAGLHRHAVEQYRTGAAVGGVAADVGAGHAERLAQQVDEKEARLDLRLVAGAVDLDLNLMLRHDSVPPGPFDGVIERAAG